jgi:shikimate kinase
MGPQHLFLIGYRGTGKSTVGVRLAKRLGRNWVDTDRWVEEQSRQTIPELFSGAGEEFFRNWETRAIEDVCREHAPPSVVSLGGGAVLRSRNRELLSSHGRCVWLQAETSRIAERLAMDVESGVQRPSLTSAGTLAEIVQVLTLREPLYRQAADLQVATDSKSVDEVVDEIALWYSQQN